MSAKRPDELALYAVLEEVEAGRIQVYRNVLNQPWVFCDHPNHPNVNWHLFDEDFRGWFSNFIWEKCRILSREREIDRILELLAGRSLQNHISTATDPALLEIIEKEPVVAVVVEFMHGKMRHESTMEGLYKVLSKFAEERGLCGAGRRRFPGGPHVLSRKLRQLTGASRSGKTAMVKLFVRSLSCQALNEETLDPCDRICPTCRQRAETFGLQGIDAAIAVAQARMEVHFSVVDCTKIHTPDQLREHLIGVNDWQEGLRIYYFDEVHRLVNRGMDEMLLKEVEEKNFLWIFSTAKPQNLEDMFVNRLIRLETELPASTEMERWLCDRCDDWGIKWEPEAILRVVEKSNRIVGTALHALALAAIEPDEGLTLDLVENDWKVRLDE